MIQAQHFRPVKTKPYVKRRSPLFQEQCVETYEQNTTFTSIRSISHPVSINSCQPRRSLTLYSQPPTKRMIRFYIVSTLILLLSILTAFTVFLQLYSQKRHQSESLQDYEILGIFEPATTEMDGKFSLFTKKLFQTRSLEQTYE
ncbi:hypothetical protein M0813_02442 [Anaeramoeba flamelloides]|uniref:Uncharacterized protein n=1 Tax=Anaeramoeba flamelloides TaxID=1746091 RepID=A0ABQ8YDG6_9EUKA|nr:hypothetical protein M0813_02442 [Anaeramoeba flamelloides]